MDSTNVIQDPPPIQSVGPRRPEILRFESVPVNFQSHHSIPVTILPVPVDINGKREEELVEKQRNILHEEINAPRENRPYDYQDPHEPEEVNLALRGNIIHRARKRLMPYAGEFLGTTVFVMFGCGSNCQVNLTSDPAVRPAGPAGNWTSLSIGWGAGLALGVWISGGGHINPAVTLSMAVFRGFPWRRVPFYWLAQLLGGIVGAAITYGNWIRAIDIYEGGRNIRTLRTAGFFGTVPLDYVTNLECFFSEFTGAALLVMGIFAMIDSSKNEWRGGQVPIGIFILFTAIAIAFGAQTSFANNPARDLGPRMFTAMVGYGGVLFTFRNWYWLYGPILGSFTGGLLGAALYDIFLYGDRRDVVERLLNAVQNMSKGTQNRKGTKIV